MKKLLLFFNLFFIPSAFATPYFWSFKKDGTTVYLLGTIHQGVAIEDLSCPDSSNNVRDSLLISDLVFIETTESWNDTPLNGLSRQDIKTILIGSIQEREQIYKKLSQEKRILIESYMEEEITEIISIVTKSNGLLVDEDKESPELLSDEAKKFLLSRGIELEDDFSNIYYTIGLSNFFIISSFLFDEKMDLEVRQLAQENGIPLSPLDDRTALYEELTKTDHIETKRIEVNKIHVEEFINNSKAFLINQREYWIQQLINPYLNEQISFELVSSLVSSLGIEQDILLKDRNALWVERILTALENSEYKNIFVAGGLAHFIGKDNVLDMLKKEGFTVKRETCLQ